MDFLKLAVDYNPPHLDKIINVAVKSFFDQNDKTVPWSNEEEIVVIANLHPTNNNGMRNTTNVQSLIQLNQVELLRSCGEDENEDDATNEHFGTRSRSSLDKSDETQN